MSEHVPFPDDVQEWLREREGKKRVWSGDAEVYEEDGKIIAASLVVEDVKVVGVSEDDALTGLQFALTSRLGSEFKHQVDMRSVVNGYAGGSLGAPQKILFACFGVLADFIENEWRDEYHQRGLSWDELKEAMAQRIGMSIVISNGDWERANLQAIYLYRWWTDERPKCHRLSRLACEKEERDFSSEIRRLEQDDDQMLRLLLDVRPYLWE